MTQRKKKARPSIPEAWEMLFESLPIKKEIEENGYYILTANQIKEHGGNVEPRNMAKWDSSEQLPTILKKNKLNLLPIRRGSYILSDIKLYEEIPELTEQVIDMTKVHLPEYETISINNITSESNAINVLLLSKILDEFLLEENVETFNGRMGTGRFEFLVDRFSGGQLFIEVNGAQCEIDGGLENDNSVVIIEAKNVVHSDFHIRQLYYPYRTWLKKVTKPIRLVFAIYSNQIYRLFEYKFKDYQNYSSIELVREKNYSLQDTDINNEDLWEVYKKTIVKYNDNEKGNKVQIDPDSKKKEKLVPFIQADSFERVISLVENLNVLPMNSLEIADLMAFEPRQSNYYVAAAKYLGLLEMILVEGESGKIERKYSTTQLAKNIQKLNYKERQLKYVQLILEHKIFNELFLYSYETGSIPDKNLIMKKMKKYNVCGSSLISRRSSSVLGWIKWIFNLTNL